VRKRQAALGAYGLGRSDGSHGVRIVEAVGMSFETQDCDLGRHNLNHDIH